VLLSLLGVHAKDLEALRESINKLLRAAKADSEDWVQVTSRVVEKFLPPPLRKNKDPEGNKKDEDDDQPDLYLESLSEIYKRITGIFKDVEDKGEPLPFVLPADFLPLEWPYLSYNLLPKDFDISLSRQNLHFKAREPEKTISAKVGEAPGTERQQPGVKSKPFRPNMVKKPALLGKVPDSIQQKAVENNRPQMKILDPAEMEKQQKDKLARKAAEKERSAADSNPKPKPNPAAASPSGGLAAVLDTANKLTPENRKIIEDYMTGGKNPNPSGPSVVTILLSETRRYVDNKTAVALEQTKLKIDYANKTMKKVKAVKKYKLKGK